MIKTGTSVQHSEFGIGAVISSTETKAKVKFQEVGVQTVSVSELTEYILS